jgi:hypothetical protein
MEIAGSRLKTVESHTASSFHFLLTDDEYHHEMWVTSGREADELEWSAVKRMSFVEKGGLLSMLSTPF